ncbi:MAG: glucosaminidase domain-containing protein [Treponema sp.]|jgi:hypothetical protein|nr:glucosaminidase domain-containing protein [Treponema sp.]
MIKNTTSVRNLSAGALLLAALLLPLLFSCAGGPRFNSTPVLTAPENPVQFPPEMPPENPAQLPPEKPLLPPLPVYIMGEGLTGRENLVKFLLDSNPKAEESFVSDLVAGYIKEAAAEGVNHDVAFAQMCLETGFLRFGGLVTPDMNNFCGLGAIGPGKNGERFPDAPTGIRAHIQHLKAYATEEPLKQELVDPRYFWVRYGSSPKIEGLAGTWAADKQYAVKLENILERLYRFSFQ